MHAIAPFAVSGTMALILGAPKAIGFVAQCIVLVVKTAAGVAYLTIDLTVRGLVGASKIAWNALPKASPPPAHWRIQEDYKPSVRESRHAPNAISLNDCPPIVLSAAEIQKLAGGAVNGGDITTSVVDVTEEQLAALLGQSRLQSSSYDPTSQIQSPGNANNTTFAPQPIRLASPDLTASKAPSSSSFQHLPAMPSNQAPHGYTSSTTVDDSSAFANAYPAGIVSQDAFAGFLSQSVRNIQERQETSPGFQISEEEVEEMIISDPAWIPPQDAAPGYNARKLEESVDLHASRLRVRDPIVDSWMGVSAPMADQ